MNLIFLFLLLSLFSCSPAENKPLKENKLAASWTNLSTYRGDLPVPGSSKQQTASLVLDVDRDGVNDFVIGCRTAPPSLVWYKRGVAGWTRLVIDTTTLAIEAGGACYDLDSDGDLDIVMGGDYSSSKVWWWENPYPHYDPLVPWVRREIKSGGETKHHDQIFGDFDGDGDAELVFWNQGARKLFLADIPSNPKLDEPWKLTPIYQYEERVDDRSSSRADSWKAGNEHEGLAAADIDSDGKVDIVGGGRWYKHVTGKTFKVEEIDPLQTFSRVAAGQIKKGGRPEVVMVIGDGVGPIKWYEWKDSKWIGHDLLGYDVDHGHTLQVADLDSDGNIDIFCAEMRLNGANPDAKMWAFLGDGNGKFRTRVIAEGYDSHESRAADLDGDGDVDILGKPYNWETPRLDLWLNDGVAFSDHAGVPFEHVIIDEHGPENPHIKATGDIDGDGLTDALTASSSGGPLVWYRAPRWEKYLIAGSGTWSCDAVIVDVDGDGDNDVVISEYYSKNRLEWYENQAPREDTASGTWKLHVIGSPRAHDIEAGDLDGDGDVDIAARGQSGFGAKEGNKIVLWEQKNPDSWEKRIVSCPPGEGLAIGDLDNDRDLDLVTGGRWYENEGGISGTWKEHTFCSWPQDAVVKLADMNGDRRLDAVLTISEDSGHISWFEAPIDPKSKNWPEHVIDTLLEKGHSLGVADMDLDGHPDVVTAEMHQSVDPDEVIVFLNRGGALAWQKQVIAVTGSHFLQLADFDGDGDMDIFGANWRSLTGDSLTYIEVWRNNLVNSARIGLGPWRRHVVDTVKPWRSIFIASGDLDGDGLPDIITGGWWYKNPGIPGGAWERRDLGEPLHNMAAVYDFDGDGRLDVLGTTGKGSEPSPVFVWAHNLGNGGFDIYDMIEKADGDFLQGAAAARFRPEAPVEVALSWHLTGKGLQIITLPQDPLADKWSLRKISDISQDEQLSAGDIDGDGDLDLLLGTVWLENELAGWTRHKFFETDLPPDRNRLADMNEDSRLDAVVGYEAINVPGKLAWYENAFPGRDLWTEHLIAEVVGPMSLDVADFDGDGDLDVVVGEHNYAKPETARTLIFENLDGRGDSWKEHLVYTGDEHHDGTQAVDIDNDGDLDIISIGWENPAVILYENKALDRIVRNEGNK